MNVVRLSSVRRIGACCVLMILSGCGNEPMLEGRVEVTQVNVASKYPGRISKLHVREGERVTAGQVLIEIDSPEAQAKRDQADAQLAAASATQSKVLQGARVQELRQAQAAAAAAESQRELAEMSFGRMQRLFAAGVIARQRLDEARTALSLARENSAASEALYSMAKEGLRVQDKDVARAAVAGATGMREEVEAALIETRLQAPVNGEIVQSLLHEGEIVAPGYPILIVALTDDPWVSFNVREDKLARLKMGALLEARIPALGSEAIRLRIDYLAALGDFATWRSTRDLGSFDLRTFEIRARPTTPVDGLRAGMSVLVAQRAEAQR